MLSYMVVKAELGQTARVGGVAGTPCPPNLEIVDRTRFRMQSTQTGQVHITIRSRRPSDGDVHIKSRSCSENIHSGLILQCSAAKSNCTSYASLPFLEVSQGQYALAWSLSHRPECAARSSRLAHTLYFEAGPVGGTETRLRPRPSTPARL